MRFAFAVLFALTVAAMPAGFGGGAALAADPRIVTIGTGGVTGVYYPAGGAICRMVNKHRAEHGIRCAVEATDGSVENLESLRAGDLDLGIAQADWVHHAWEGGAKYQNRAAFAGLRTLLELHAESFTVVARKATGIRTFDDLKGRRVSLGITGSGQRATAEVLLAAMDWTLKDFSAVPEVKPAEQSAALCDDRVDAIIYVVGHPNGAIIEATTSCDAGFVAVDNAGTASLIAENPFYAKTVIPAKLYRGNPADTPTFGVHATLVATAALPDDVAYALVKAVMENFDDFRKLHPAFAGLVRESMVPAQSTVPVHPGALRYFQEIGLR
ncbi:TAXI family TRAP transporter solute-binding subunit [Rhodospirillum rubrum]|uniref:TRAP transporter solute receptor, TAXI family n=1 Tax=Rhodospirillum rubrum (strain ATCC 11170 / ATH 1.1.1 / DSM 467 / LMG 4362 / NCIMB 8255 / S1) TaxID=269796 RepID=Q2RWT3_RHORT|nr:TAXI family TRAP transporter solute-binding subunit [Rhodospirillum rubrum]ABC21412.1 TRAP transporter solute receptor, TAXI family [Rhodospirillum rubrum ATCC 11170]AEO47092.1 TRAP transporter solute receptor TAXI family protein [Rhodospirillum rubrum F11]MBK5953005.1 C4-dicarboxylate ABC transporter substrate-binding protein [Rhodospirillum rubrum]QXG81089.1 TAXI family TRAP transporter solute-binding subunit [Rhodospirillum rubrum]HAP98611.1 C4-dicarboxylate ABC transporter substrate-bin